ncbi:glucose-1-phosphate adenylyltransferase [Paenibacillus alginolyticus]|uniref:Glucose-1-phosphate adenylyltransferase n=1 Tax=Paenibacillus alginolyticus TaxID=59839 RepID=A0ABT4GJ68_9BACL|nr:glucose-1-phosphate adenylyltransferase [Paenibacillus alginolyticus]MCY9664975.1 glucose-1-phosphate adenylyltransferase [Paenibacillus alginolyticus]MCY9696078.1 glucose-1-phosphate adenylyltransferase [Paenibacillus alginolyticus]MEC0147474.1 glucose-1-phosphate adenylyltransferase [Paenibacillus alginolyticus]
MKKQECVAMLLAGGEGTRLGPLTKNIAKPAVHFGGKYRIIDFTLSNCRNSGMNTVGVLTQYKPAVLHAHIGNGEAWDMASESGGISILERQIGAPNAYSGTADAIYQNMSYLRAHDPSYVLIISGDHIYHMDYRAMLEHHKASGADATLSVTPVRWEEASRFGIMSTDEHQWITGFAEKPLKPSSNLASMGVYIFNWDVLKACLEQDARDMTSRHDFGHDIIPGLLAAGAHLSAYSYEGYWKDVGTIEGLWESHMDLLGYTPRLQLDQDTWPVLTQERDLPKSHVSLVARVNNAMIGDGAAIYGNVSHSVLFDGVRVGENSRVLNSVIMPGVQIGKNALILNAVVGEGSIIKDGAIVGKPGGAEITAVGEKTVVGRHYPAVIPAKLTDTRLNFG